MPKRESWHEHFESLRDEAATDDVPDENESTVLDANEPEVQESAPAPGIVPPQGPYKPYGRHVVDLHHRRIASCSDVPGREATEIAALIAEALNR